MAIEIQNGNWVNVIEGSFILIDCNKGVYIPKVFVQRWGNVCISGITQKEIDILLDGPDNNEYWDCWDDVVDNIRFLFDGQLCSIFQDDDLFAVPVN